VQKTPHRRQKPCRRSKLAAGQPALGLAHPAKRREPFAHVRVAQAAGAVFDIRLKVKQRVPILRVADARQGQQLGADGLGIARHHLGDGLGLELFENRRLARDQSTVQQRQTKLRVVGVESLALAYCARHRRYSQPAIPQRLRRAAHSFFGWLALFHTEHHVDVGVGKELCPPVSTDRHYSYFSGGFRIESGLCSPQPRQEFVHELCARGDCSDSVPSRIKLAPDCFHPPHVFFAHRFVVRGRHPAFFRFRRRPKPPSPFSFAKCRT